MKNNDSGNNFDQYINDFNKLRIKLRGYIGGDYLRRLEDDVKKLVICGSTISSSDINPKDIMLGSLSYLPGIYESLIEIFENLNCEDVERQELIEGTMDKILVMFGSKEHQEEFKKSVRSKAMEMPRGTTSLDDLLEIFEK